MIGSSSNQTIETPLVLNIQKLLGGFTLENENFPNDVMINKEEVDVKGFEIKVEGSCP